MAELIVNLATAAWNIENETGYEPITTFWSDFSIADKFGVSAVKDTFKRAFNEWKSNYKYLTELVLVLNHKGWDFYNSPNSELSNLYFSLYKEADSYAVEHLKGAELDYFYCITD